MEMNSNILGNVRTGMRGENDRPIKLSYFNVHIDKSTSSLAVELFNKAYNKPSKLKIKFASQNPLNVYMERYEGKRRKCYGNGKKARVFNDKGESKIIECNEKECPYRNTNPKQCKDAARLYFFMEKISPEEGLWCFPIGSEKGIRYIKQRIARANRMNVDLTKNWYELYLITEDAPTVGKNYIPDIREVEKINKEKIEIGSNEKKQEETNNSNGNKKENNNDLKYLMIKGFLMTMYKNKKVPKIKFINTEKKEVELILLPEDNQDILKLQPGSIILPLRLTKTENNKIILLHDYKVLKAITKKIENKKAV